MLKQTREEGECADSKVGNTAILSALALTETDLDKFIEEVLDKDERELHERFDKKQESLVRIAESS